MFLRDFGLPELLIILCILGPFLAVAIGIVVLVIRGKTRSK